ncbi:MAG: hypothetical protein IKF82_02445 [Bacilli bacterium]|nr:hypothetical protein [Bacilli bacterium]
MILSLFNNIKQIAETKLNDLNIENDENLNICLSGKCSEEDKELLLCELDKNLPIGIFFHHEFKNGKLKIIFEEVQ